MRAPGAINIIIEFYILDLDLIRCLDPDIYDPARRSSRKIPVVRIPIIAFVPGHIKERPDAWYFYIFVIIAVNIVRCLRAAVNIVTQRIGHGVAIHIHIPFIVISDKFNI